MILSDMEGREIQKANRNLTTAMILSNREQYPSIAKQLRQGQEDDLIDAIGVLLDEVNAFFGDHIKDEAIEDLCVELTTGKYRNLTLDDVYIITREIKEADIYGNLTANKVLKFANDYYERRINKAEQMSMNRHLSMKGSGSINTARKDSSLKGQDAEAIKWFLQKKGTLPEKPAKK